MEQYIISGKKYSCPLILSLESISGKWKGVILWFLIENQVLRYGEIKSKINSVMKVTDKMLIQCLKELELDGLVERKVFKVVPPKVEYSLTSRGKKLRPIFDELVKFGISFKK